MYGTLHLVTILALKVPSTQAASIDVYKPRPEVTQKSSDGVYVTNAATTLNVFSISNNHFEIYHPVGDGCIPVSKSSLLKIFF